MFEIGQKVMCVDDVFPPGIRDIYNALPKLGVTYTVRDLVPGVGMSGNRENDQQPAVYLAEIVNLPNRHGIEPGFACRRFAELEEAEETISSEYELAAINGQNTPKFAPKSQGLNRDTLMELIPGGRYKSHGYPPKGGIPL